MLVGEIKIEALKLMFVNYSHSVGVDDLQSFISDENYGSYIVNMNGAINRAIDRIENACVMPQKRIIIENGATEKVGAFISVDLDAISDFFMLDRVTAQYANGEYDGCVEYHKEANNLLLVDDSSATYTLIYYPKIKSVTDNDKDQDEIWLPDRIARLIPYYIKGDLFQEEEPELAADARNIFEAQLDDLKTPSESKQNSVKQVYRMW